MRPDMMAGPIDRKCSWSNSCATGTALCARAAPANTVRRVATRRGERLIGWIGGLVDWGDGHSTNYLTIPLFTAPPIPQSSLRPHRDRRVDARGAQRGNPAGDQADDTHQPGDTDQSGRIACIDAEEKAPKHPDGEPGAGKSQKD